MPVDVLRDLDDIGDRLAPRQLVGVVFERPDEHHRPVVGLDRCRPRVTVVELRRHAQAEDSHELVHRPGRAGAGEDDQHIVIAAERVPDDPARVLPQPRRLQARAARLGVRVRVPRQHLAADEVLDERQRPATRRVVGVGDPSRAVRPVGQRVVADDALANLCQQCRRRQRRRGHRRMVGRMREDATMTSANGDSPDANGLLELAVRLARDAAALIRERPTDLGADTKATPTDAVTVTDRASEQLILAGLAEVRPQDTVAAEESGTTSGTRTADDVAGGVRWYVDPLDGTVNYLYELPHFAVSIAAEVDGEIVAGVVLDVATGDEYVAIRGGGAHCNGRQLACRNESELALSLIATGFSYDAVRRASQAEILRAVLPRVRDIRRMGAAALDLCAVRAGHVGGYYGERLKPWHWAAGALVAHEAGARVGTIGDGPLGTSVALAANATLYGALEALVVAATEGAQAGNDASAP